MSGGVGLQTSGTTNSRPTNRIAYVGVLPDVNIRIVRGVSISERAALAQGIMWPARWEQIPMRVMSGINSRNVEPSVHIVRNYRAHYVQTKLGGPS